MAVGRSIGRHAHTPGAVWARCIDGPAVFRWTNRDFLPEFVVFGLVLNVKVVEVKATEVGLDLVDAVITPVLSDIPDHMAVRADKTLVVPMRLKVIVVEGVNIWNKAKGNGLEKLSFGTMEIRHDYFSIII